MSHQAPTVAKARREIDLAYQSLTVTVKAPLCKAKAEWSRVSCPVLVVEEFSPEICNELYFNHLVGSLGGLNARWNSYRRSVHLIFAGISQIQLLQNLHINLHYSILPSEVEDFLNNCLAVGLHLDDSNKNIFLYLPDRDYLSSLPVLVLNSNSSCLVQPDFFDRIANFLEHHTAVERDRGSRRVDQIFAPQNTTDNSLNTNVNLPAVTTRHDNTTGWSEGLVSSQSLAQDLALLAPILTECVDTICSQSAEVDFNVLPFSDDRVINLFANRLLKLKNCSGGGAVNRIPNVSVGSTGGKVLLDAHVDVGNDPDWPNNFNVSLIGIGQIHDENVVDKSTASGTGEPHADHTYLLRKDIQVSALSREQRLLRHQLMIDRIRCEIDDFMENEENNKKDEHKDNTFACKYRRIHCGGYSGKSLRLGACRFEAFSVIISDIDLFLKNTASSRAAVDISILKMELPDDKLDDGRSICVKQPYLDKIGGYYSLYASDLHGFMYSQKKTLAECIDRIYSIVWTPSPSAWLNVVSKVDKKRCSASPDSLLLPFTVDYLRTSIAISGSISAGRHRRFQPSVGKSFRLQLIFMSLSNLIQIIENARTGKWDVYRCIAAIASSVRKGGVFGVGELQAHHLVSVCGLVGILPVSYCTDARFCHGNNTTKYFERNGLTSPVQFERLMDALVLHFDGRYHRCFLENAVCEYWREVRNQALGGQKLHWFDTFVEGQFIFRVSKGVVEKINKDGQKTTIGMYCFNLLPQQATNSKQIHWWDRDQLALLPEDVGNVIVMVKDNDTIKQRRAEQNRRKTKRKRIRGRFCDNNVSNDEKSSRGPTRWRAKPLRESRTLRARRVREDLERKSAKNRIAMVSQLNTIIEEMGAEGASDESDFEFEDEELVNHPDLFDGSVFVGSDQIPVPSPLSLAFLPSFYRRRVDLFGEAQLVLCNRRFSKRDIVCEGSHAEGWVASCDTKGCRFTSNGWSFPCGRRDDGLYVSKRDATNSLLMNIIHCLCPGYLADKFLPMRRLVILEDSSTLCDPIDHTWIILFRDQNSHVRVASGKVLMDMFPVRESLRSELTFSLEGSA